MERDLPRPKPDDALQQVMMTAPISKLITGKDLLVAKKSDTILKVVQVLQAEKKDCILIYERKKLVGIVSFRDLLRKASRNDLDLAKTPIERVMTPNPEYVKPDDPIAFMVNKMAMGGFRHVPVLQKDGTPVTIVSIKDVLGYLSRRRPAIKPTA
ncbi:MAG: CBS domain-containing protein [Candidatus Omnitrophica bacterium]|nr:CBS domain-containing protein [Candidatus Omnitrophota bacterium]